MLQPRIEPPRHDIAAKEPTEVCKVVDAAHEEAKDEKHDRIGHCLPANLTAASPLTVVDQRPQQSENRRRGAHGKPCPLQ